MNLHSSDGMTIERHKYKLLSDIHIMAHNFSEKTFIPFYKKDKRTFKRSKACCDEGPWWVRLNTKVCAYYCGLILKHVYKKKGKDIYRKGKIST